MKLVLGIHDHQPVGNFGWVIEEIYDKSYAPFLDVVERHPTFRFSLHVTGPLFEWIEQNRPEWLDRVAALVAEGRVEVLGGGWYEPILASIPEADRIGQIALTRERVKERLGTEPRGVWMAERVWEPHIAGSLNRAGVEFALLDDFHFVQAGIPAERLESGPLLTDDLGAEVALMPIDEKLRYLIPFQDPAQTVARCREVHERDPDGVLVMVDDGEKFGAWPGTAELVYGKGWLERFIEALAAESDWLELAHPSEVLDARPPRERAYLPPNSYFEMSEWSLPMPAAAEYEAMVESYRKEGRWETMRPFVRGGFWRQFFQKYEESLLMQRRALHLHEEIAAAEREGADETRIAEARDHLWRAQCNCAYWHGVFGGLTLPHLRHAVWRHIILGTEIIRTTRPVAPVGAATIVGREGRDVRLSSDSWDLFLSPDRGGALVSWEDRAEEWNLQNTLRRRREAYHARIEAAPAPGEAEAADDGASIHDIQWEVTPEVRAALGVDPQPRYSLLDRLLHADATADEARADMAAADGGDLAASFAGCQAGEGASAAFGMEGRYRDRDGTERPVRIVKTVSLDGPDAMQVTWAVANTGDAPLDCRFASEWNLAFYDGGVFLDGVDEALGEAELDARDTVAVRVPLHRARLTWGTGGEWSAWSAPVRTATQGEDGYHLTYQGHMLLFHRPLTLAPGETATFTLGVTMDHGVADDA